MPKWNTLAASTASAPASAAATKWSAVPAPPDAMRGTVDHCAHVADHLEVEAIRGAVGVHRVEEDLARAELRAPPRPLDGVDPRAPTAAVGRHLVSRGRLDAARAPPSVDGEHEHLVPEPLRDLGDQLRVARWRRCSPRPCRHRLAGAC